MAKTAADWEALAIYVINFIFFCIGVCLIAVGALGYAEYAYLEEFIGGAAFAFFLAAGCFVLVFCFLGCASARCVLTDSNVSLGRVGLIIYSIIMFAFIVLEIVGGVVWLVYAGEIEVQKTGNVVLDTPLSSFQHYVDRRVNCSFNYCCQDYKSTVSDKIVRIRDPPNFNLQVDDVNVPRNELVNQKLPVDDLQGRSKAYQYYKGDNNYVPLWVETQFKTQYLVTTEQIQNRTQWLKQYYNGFEDYERVTLADTTTVVEDPDWSATTTVAYMKKCDPYSAVYGDQCWIKWRAQCPDPIDSIDEAGWNEICTFVHEKQTWEDPRCKDPSYPCVNNNDPPRWPMLNHSMCNMGGADTVGGRGATDPTVGYKQAVIWKVQRSVGIAVGVLVLGVLQFLMLIVVCVAIFHRASGNTSLPASDPSAMEAGHKQPKQAEGENKTFEQAPIDEMDDPAI